MTVFWNMYTEKMDWNIYTEKMDDLENIYYMAPTSCQH